MLHALTLRPTLVVLPIGWTIVSVPFLSPFEVWKKKPVPAYPEGHTKWREWRTEWRLDLHRLGYGELRQVLLLEIPQWITTTYEVEDRSFTTEEHIWGSVLPDPPILRGGWYAYGGVSLNRPDLRVCRCRLGWGFTH